MLETNYNWFFSPAGVGRGDCVCWGEGGGGGRQGEGDKSPLDSMERLVISHVTASVPEVEGRGGRRGGRRRRKRERKGGGGGGEVKEG